MNDSEEAQAEALTCHRAARAALAAGDSTEALQLLQRALSLFEHAGAAVGHAAVLVAIADVQHASGEHERALETWARLFPVLDMTGDVNERALTLDKMAMVSAKLGRWPQALELWRQALDIDSRCGTARDQAPTVENIKAAEAKVRVGGVQTQSRAGILSNEGPFSLSELTLAPNSAPLFRVGELLAALHCGGFHYGNLRPGHMQIMPDATAAIARATDVDEDQPLDPVRMAADLSTPFATFPRADFRAILAGYVRAGYERIDARQPGFTDAVLDVLGAAVERPPPRNPVLDIPRLLTGLGLDFVVEPGSPLWPGLGVASALPWPARLESSTDAAALLLCCLILDVGCEPVLLNAEYLFGSNLGVPFRNFFLVAQGYARPDAALVAQLPRGLELAARFAMSIPGALEGRPLAFENLLPLVIETLAASPIEQASRFGDALVDVALHSASVMTHQSAALASSIAQAQKAVTILQCQADGSAQDEARLAALTRGLCQLPWYPAPNAKGWPATPLDLRLASSLLDMYRTMTAAALHSARGDQRSGLLWSPAYRGIDLARASVRRIYAMLSGADPELFQLGLQTLPMIVKTYAWLLDGFLLLSAHENTRAGTSGWLSVFVGRGGQPSHLERERQWLDQVLTAMEGDVLVREATAHLRVGTRFFGQGT